MGRRLAPAALVVALALGGCTGAAKPDTRADTGPAASASTTPSPSAQPSPSPASPEPTPAPRVRFDADRAMRDVRTLAGEIGTRLATGPGFREAARLVERRFERHGYEVRRQSFPVPAGNSWGVPVDAGTSVNVIASRPGFDPAKPHRIVGAHLDTVAVSPGAEDNASGISLLLELARLADAEGTALPTVLIAFGAEEPRGPTDADHHYGSQHYVREMPHAQRRTLRSMVALDRVGVPGAVPVCTGPLSPHRIRDDLLAIAQQRGIPAEPCELTTSDHWSFEKAGFTVARLGSRDYAAYHSEADLPPVVSRDQLRRAGRIAWAWLRP